MSQMTNGLKLKQLAKDFQEETFEYALFSQVILSADVNGFKSCSISIIAKQC